MSRVKDPVPLALPLSPSTPIDCLRSMLDCQGPYKTFDITARIALLVGAALSYANDPRPVRLAGSSYADTYTRLENLVHDIISTAEAGTDSYTYCESAALAVM